MRGWSPWRDASVPQLSWRHPPTRHDAQKATTMTALARMLEETERLIQRCELRLEQYQIHAASGGDPDVSIAMRRHQNAYRKAKLLRAKIRRDIAAENAEKRA